MTCNFTLKGETPSKKNSRINTNSGRSFPNKHFMEWHKEKLAELSAMLLENEIKRFGSIQIRIKMVFYHGDLRRRDSDNQCSSIMDLLVDSGIIDDDNWLIVREKLIKDYYDKNNARCEIKIETIGS